MTLKVDISFSMLGRPVDINGLSLLNVTVSVFTVDFVSETVDATFLFDDWPIATSLDLLPAEAVGGAVSVTPAAFAAFDISSAVFTIFTVSTAASSTIC
jgi:hypothetical protein